MAKAFVVWDGLTELLAALKAMPETCAGEAAHLVDGAANGAYVDISGAYPIRTGNLRKGMRLQRVVKKGLEVGAEVKNVAPHANLFEIGTQARHTKIGANRGSMPPGHVFVPRILKARRRLTQDLKDMVVRTTGATVTDGG
jgi:hypothetical protein